LDAQLSLQNTTLEASHDKYLFEQVFKTVILHLSNGLDNHNNSHLIRSCFPSFVKVAA